MIQTDDTFKTANTAPQKSPLYLLEVDELDVAFCTFPTAALQPLATGYGIQGYGVMGYGF